MEPGQRAMVRVSPFERCCGTIEHVGVNVRVNVDRRGTYEFYRTQVDAFEDGDDRPAPNGDAWETQMLELCKIDCPELNRSKRKQDLWGC